MMHEMKLMDVEKGIEVLLSRCRLHLLERSLQIHNINSSTGEQLSKPSSAGPSYSASSF
jgi:hypothetical protein